MAEPPPLPLHAAALRCGPAAGLELQRLLLAREVAVNSSSRPHGFSALHVAAMLGRADLCSMLLVAGADPARQLSYCASVATLASWLHGLVPAEQAIPAAAKAHMHRRVAACSLHVNATPLDLSVAVDEFAAAERLAAASPEAVLTQALHTWVFAHSAAGCSPPRFSLALLLLGAGADPYCAVDQRYERSRASFLQRLCASADRPEASKADRDSLLYTFSWLFSRDVKPGRPLSTPRLRQLLRAALLLGLTEHCLQLLCRPEDSTTAEGSDAEERASLLALAVRQDQPVVVAEMVRCRELDGPPRFDPNETWVPAEGARLQLLLVYAVRHCSTAIVDALLAGGANPNDDPGPDDGIGMTALHWAVMRGDVHIVRLLVGAGAGLDHEARPLSHRGEGGQNLDTPLLTAVLQRKWECVEALLEAGADVNGFSSCAHSPLLVALFTGDVALAERLIRRGADVNKLAGENGHAAYNIARLQTVDGQRGHSIVGTASTLLEAACFTKAPTTMIALLLSEGADTSARPDDLGPLPAASGLALHDAVELLLAHPRPPGGLAAMGWEDSLLFAAGGADNVAQLPLGTPPGSVLGLLLDAGQQAGLLSSLYAGAADDLHEAVQFYLSERRERQGLLSSGVVQQAAARAQLLASYGLVCPADEAVRAASQRCPGLFGASSLLVKLAGLPVGERWSPVLHRHHPPALKAAVRLLLLAAHRAPEKRRRRSMWHLLPRDVMLRVLALAGSDIQAWLAIS
ncbi:hypothetical protein ABPG77_006406 [Micractinium sp. CCAP 211/92]